MNKTIANLIKSFMYKDAIASLWLINFNITDNKNIDTYLLSVDNGLINLQINTDWLEATKANFNWFKQMVLHVMFYHFSFDRADKDKLKIAFELAVNQYTGRVLSTDIMIEDVEKYYNIKLEKGKNYSYYYDKIPTTDKPLSSLLSIGGNSSDESKNVVDAIYSNTVDSVLPGSDMNQFYKEWKQDRKISKPKLNRLRIVSGLVSSQGNRVKIKSTRFKKNLYYENGFGTKFEKIGSILIAVDTSGSVTENQYVEFLSQIQHLFGKYNIELIHCDTDIRYQGKFNPKDKTIYGGGGTDFTKVIEYYNKSNHKSLLYFTDLYGGTKVLPKKPMYWVCDEKQYNRSFKQLPNTKIVLI